MNFFGVLGMKVMKEMMVVNIFSSKLIRRIQRFLCGTAEVQPTLRFIGIVRVMCPYIILSCLS
jgi:hypothetical protein